MLDAARQPLCPSSELEERGRAFVFDVMHFRQPARAFVLRFDGRIVAYLNRCAHVPTEMDWQPGEFLDMDKAWILCSIHGAAYDPPTGRCIAGPCGRGRLTALDVREEAGQVYWYPSRDTRPVFDDDTEPLASTGTSP
jgi:nitrite reductase/ring-hydroxylating ferredoxin subunit